MVQHPPLRVDPMLLPPEKPVVLKFIRYFKRQNEGSYGGTVEMVSAIIQWPSMGGQDVSFSIFNHWRQFLFFKVDYQLEMSHGNSPFLIIYHGLETQVPFAPFCFFQCGTFAVQN